MCHISLGLLAILIVDIIYMFQVYCLLLYPTVVRLGEFMNFNIYLLWPGTLLSTPNVRCKRKTLFPSVIERPITVERLTRCDWPLDEFIEVNFAKLATESIIFRNDIAFIIASVNFQLKLLSAFFFNLMNCV